MFALMPLAQSVRSQVQELPGWGQWIFTQVLACYYAVNNCFLLTPSLRKADKRVHLLWSPNNRLGGRLPSRLPLIWQEKRTRWQAASAKLKQNVWSSYNFWSFTVGKMKRACFAAGLSASFYHGISCWNGPCAEWNCRLTYASIDQPSRTAQTYITHVVTDSDYHHMVQQSLMGLIYEICVNLRTDFWEVEIKKHILFSIN